MLAEDVPAHLDPVLGSDTHDEGVECTVVDCAHSDPIGDDGFSTLSVFADVGRIEQLRMTKPTERTLTFIGGQDSASEVRLVNAPTNGSEGILPPANLVGSCEKYVALP